MSKIVPVARKTAAESLDRPRGKSQPFAMAYPDACGIDIGSSSHFVAVPADRDGESVREFRAFTADLQALVAWLRQCQITAVAMESTAVYWIPLYEMLDEAGIEVHLVNARHVKSVPGRKRKSDVLDCQWLQQLMTFGLLRGAFRPADEVCALRAVWSHRDMLLSYQARHVQHLQKALTQMNVQLHHVITDLMGVTGQAIVRAIVAGERNAEVLAALRECDVELERLLGALKAHELPDDGLGRPKRRTPAKNAVRHFDTRSALFEASGVDLTRIPGIDTSTALKVISEVGTDLRRFPTVKHFTSWMGLCPGTKISGGKVLSSATKRCGNRAAQALRMAAQALRRSQSALGAYHRRLCARMDRPKAFTATAHKLARLIDFMLTKGQPYVDVGQQYYEDRYRERVFQNLTKRAHTLGFKLIPVAAVVSENLCNQSPPLGKFLKRA